MTIVELSSLDTFIRDSLYEVRRGIANSRNATQANPLLGVMVDLPDKVDFEIVVTSSYQSLSRSVSTIDNQSDTDRSNTRKNSLSGDNDNTITSSSDQSVDIGSSVTKDSAISKENSTDIFGSLSVGIESDSRAGAGGGTERSRGTEISNESRHGSGIETESNSTSTSETGSSSGSETESESKSGIANKSDSSNQGQGEVHLEANDRASKTFDEDDGSYGGQGQISTPKLPGSPCNC